MSLPSVEQSARRRSAFLTRYRDHPQAGYFEQRFSAEDWHRLELAGVKPKTLLVGDSSPNRYGPERPYR